MPVAQHLNDFNTIINQLSSVKIEFDDEKCALIYLFHYRIVGKPWKWLLVFFAGKSKLKYYDICDLILAEEARRKDSGKTSSLG